MKTEFRKSFENDLLKINDANLLKRVKSIIEQIERAETLSEVGNIKKIKGDADYYRIRVRNYRMGIKINNGVVSFIRILHRKEIYRYFP
ncbi:MAG: type II toxin-antitoxin system RelE family toxin [Limnospira sp.]